MKKQSLISSPEKSKVITINILFITTLIIIFSGIFFSIFSLINNIHFEVLSSSISGAIFGILVLYLGIRYYLSVTKLKEELYRSSAKFSWRNFKRK
jgi:membrane associated rhomboid family serine protease